MLDFALDPELDAPTLALTEAIGKRFLTPREKDLKEIERLTNATFFSALDVVLSRAKKLTNKDLRTNIETAMLVTYIKSDNLMRKIQGITLLSDYLKIPELCMAYLNA